MNRLDKELTLRGLVTSRSQAENYINLGLVKVDGKTISKPAFAVSKDTVLDIEGEQYVSRAALKLASVASIFDLDFKDKIVLDIGSSTGGFTDFALQHGAKKVIAVDVGTEQLHPSLRMNPKIDLHEKTDIRHFKTTDKIDYLVADVSFTSGRNILPAVKKFMSKQSTLIYMCKPQFEAGKEQINKGIIKNSAVRRQILKEFETWLNESGFIVKAKADSQVSGTKGNVERFYKLKKS